MEKKATEYSLEPYWPETMGEFVRADRMRLFEKAIYKIWGSIEAGVGDASEIETIHKCDLAVFRSGHKPDRYHSTAKDAMRKAGGDKFAQAMGKRPGGME